MRHNDRIETIIRTMLDRAGRILDAIAPPWQSRVPGHLLVRLCPKAACRRAQTCQLLHRDACRVPRPTRH